MANEIKALNDINRLLDGLEKNLQDVNGELLKISKTARNTSQNFFDIKFPKDLNNQLKQSKQFSDELNVVLKERNRIQNLLVTSQQKLTSAQSKAAKEIAKIRFETNQVNKANREGAVLTSRLATEYQKLVVKMNQASRSVQNLTAKQAQGISLSKKEQAQLKRSQREFQKYSIAVRKADAAVGRFQRNVGNYPMTIGKATRAIRSLATAFGFTGAVFIFADAMMDAARRVVEFDSSMQNIAGILRTNREDIKDVEMVIRSVASTSVKTSNEVAKLAESLFTLGKSKEEVKALLKPVVDLSIGLNAAADESGEFLVQMLNTFQRPVSEAGKFADVIATVRTSTSLDFQKMRDSFQFLAPISQVLNKDLAFTGALVGILADNGIKAERAGRLLGTAQQKLAKEGLTLNDALLEINKASESGVSEIQLLALASDLLGKQAAGLGIILAQNADNIEATADAIRNNSGALDDLVNNQLDSVSAKLKIVDSAWENLILTIEDGNNVISKLIKTGLDSLTFSLVTISAALDHGIGFFTRTAEEVAKVDNFLGKFTDTILDLNPFYTRMTEIVIEDTEARKKNAIEIDKQIEAFVKLNGSLAPFQKGKPFKNPFSLFTPGVEEASKKGRTYQDVLDDIKTQQDLLKLSTKEGAGEILDNIEVLEKERKAWERSNKAKKKAEKIIKGSIRDFEKQIETLRKNQTQTSKNSEEFAVFEHQIQVLRNTIRNLKGDFEQIEDVSLTAALDFFDSEEDAKTEIEAFKEALNTEIENAGGDISKIKILLDSAKTVKDVEDLADEIMNIIETLNSQQIELQQDFNSELRGLVSELAASISEIEIQQYEERIEANENYFNNLLENENLSDSDKKSLEAKRDAETERLEKKRAQVQQRAFIIEQGIKLGQIVIDTAQKVAAIKAQASVLASNPATAALSGLALAQIPTVIATGAAASATIIAQTIPAFEMGKDESNNYEGPAVWGEKRTEVKFNPSTGSIEFSPSTPTMTTVSKDDIIYPSVSDAFNSGSLINSAIMTSLQSQELNNYQTEKMFDSMLDKYTGRTQKEIEKGLRKAKFNVYNQAPKMDVSGLLRIQGKVDV